MATGESCEEINTDVQCMSEVRAAGIGEHRAINEYWRASSCHTNIGEHRAINEYWRASSCHTNIGEHRAINEGRVRLCRLCQSSFASRSVEEITAIPPCPL